MPGSRAAWNGTVEAADGEEGAPGEGRPAAALRRTALLRRRAGAAGGCPLRWGGGGKIKGGVLTDAALSGAKNKQRLSMCGTRLVCACLPSRVGQGCVNTYKNDMLRLKPKKHYE